MVLLGLSFSVSISAIVLGASFCLTRLMMRHRFLGVRGVRTSDATCFGSDEIMTLTSARTDL